MVRGVSVSDAIRMATLHSKQPAMHGLFSKGSIVPLHQGQAMGVVGELEFLFAGLYLVKECRSFVYAWLYASNAVVVPKRLLGGSISPRMIRMLVSAAWFPVWCRCCRTEGIR